MKLFLPRNDAENRFLAAWVAERVKCQFTPGFFSSAAIIKDDGKILAAVVYHSYRHPDIEMTVAADSLYWAKKQFIIGLLSYPFYQLRCTRVTGLVDKANKRARKLDEHLGFKLEGVHPQGNGTTILSYGLLKEDFERKWLHGQEKRTEAA